LGQEYLTEACESIDATMFSGDSFLDPKNREELRWYIGRWTRQMALIEAPDPDEPQEVKEHHS
jgi:hypothetical protein